MVIFAEVQRLLAHGPRAFPDVVLVDVGAIARWIEETDPGADPWPLIVEALQRSGKTCCWTVAPTLPWSGAAPPAELARIASRLRQAASGHIITSDEPLISILNARCLSGHMGLVSAGIDDRAHELAVLDQPISAVLDVATGKVLRGNDVAVREQMEPLLLSELEAVVTGSPPLGTRDAPKHRREIAQAIDDGLPLSAAQVHTRLSAALAEPGRTQKIADRALQLRESAIDQQARSALASWPPPTHIDAVDTFVPRILHDVRRYRDGRLALHSLYVDRGMGFRHYTEAQAESVLRDLAREAPQRWTAVQSLDLLGWMVDRNLRLPHAVFDLGIVRHALDPDGTTDSGTLSPSASLLPTVVADWMLDSSRQANAPRNWHLAATTMARVEAELEHAVQNAGLLSLVRDDLAPTLPVLAKVERNGARIGTPAGFGTWDALAGRVQRRLDRIEPFFSHVSRRTNPYANDLSDIVRVLRNWLGPLPNDQWARGSGAKNVLERYAALGHVPARAIMHARSLALSAVRWITVIAALQHNGGSQARLRGAHFPEATGRLGMREHPLHALVSDGIVARYLRSGLLAPEGCKLMAADYSAHEIRLLAGLSQDPGLLAVAQTPDPHAAFAASYLGSAAKRDLAKSCAIALVYGQSEEGFVKAAVDLTVADARALYQRLTASFPQLAKCKAGVLAAAQASGYVTTLGGWRRATGKDEATFNTLV